MGKIMKEVIEEPTSTALVTADEQALATIDFGAALAQDQDNFDKTALQIPFVRILQSNSPQLDPAEANYIPEAKVGQFFNTVTKEIFPSVEVIPVYHYSTFIEWKPDQGGFVADLGFDKGQAALATCTKDDKGKDKLPNGNQLVRSETYFILVVGRDGTIQQAMATFVSTQLKKSRNWNSRIKLLKTDIPSQGVVAGAPMYFNSWTWKTAQESNDFGKWYGYVIEAGRATLKIGVDVWKAAKAFRETVAQGVADGKVNVADTTDNSVISGDEPIPF